MSALSTARRLRDNQDAVAWFFYAVQEITKEQVADYEFTLDTFKKDGKFYVVIMNARNPGQISFTMRSRGIQNYQILEVKGKKTALKNGTFRTN